jgi:hypothetical protein
MMRREGRYLEEIRALVSFKGRKIVNVALFLAKLYTRAFFRVLEYLNERGRLSR